MTDSVERFSERPLPPYRHVPGQTPHPIRDPLGHSYGADEDAARRLPDLNGADGMEYEDFRYAVDLFNGRYWWECHEVMEQFWHASGMGTPAGHVLQAIIQCAAAHLKYATKQYEGALKLFAMAEDHVHQAERRTLGLDLIGLLADTGAFVTGDTARPALLVPESYTGAGNP